MTLKCQVILGIVQPQSDFLLRDVEPLVLHARRACLVCQGLEVGPRPVGRGLRLVALQHHVEQGLEVHDLVLEADPDGPPDVPGDPLRAVRVVERREPGSDALLVRQDLLDGRPLVGGLRVLVAEVRVVHVRVDAPFEDGVIGSGLRGRILRRLGELYVQKRRDVAQVEDASVPQLDGLILELVVREHVLRYGVPSSPEALPVFQGRDVGASVLGWGTAERHGRLGQ